MSDAHTRLEPVDRWDELLSGLASVAFVALCASVAWVVS